MFSLCVYPGTVRSAVHTRTVCNSLAWPLRRPSPKPPAARPVVSCCDPFKFGIVLVTCYFSDPQVYFSLARRKAGGEFEGCLVRVTGASILGAGVEVRSSTPQRAVTNYCVVLRTACILSNKSIQDLRPCILVWCHLESAAMPLQVPFSLNKCTRYEQPFPSITAQQGGRSGSIGVRICSKSVHILHARCHCPRRTRPGCKDGSRCDNVSNGKRRCSARLGLRETAGLRLG